MPSAPRNSECVKREQCHFMCIVATLTSMFLDRAALSRKDLYAFCAPFLKNSPSTGLRQAEQHGTKTIRNQKNVNIAVRVGAKRRCVSVIPLHHHHHHLRLFSCLSHWRSLQPPPGVSSLALDCIKGSNPLPLSSSATCRSPTRPPHSTATASAQPPIPSPGDLNRGYPLVPPPERPLVRIHFRELPPRYDLFAEPNPLIQLPQIELA